MKSLDLSFEIRPTDIDESEIENEQYLTYLERISKSKIQALTQFSFDDLRLASDTIVVFENKILHKPKNEIDAIETLMMLSNTQHSVFSSCYMEGPFGSSFHFEESRVLFHDWGRKECERYIQEYKPFDKAGSYGIQDVGGPVKSFEGSYLNILGFPMRKFLSQIDVWKGYFKD